MKLPKLFTRNSDRIADLEGKLAAAEKQFVSLMYGGGWLGTGGAVREPFLQAWQRNLEHCGAGHTDLVAFSAVYASTMVISQDVSKMPLRLMRRDNRNVLTQDFRHPISLLFRNPNDYQTMMDFVQYMLSCRLLAGNSYIYKEMDARGVTRKMHLVHPKMVQPLVAPDKSVYYAFKEGYDQEILTGEELPVSRVIPSRFIIHDRINCIWHPLIGVSPVYAAAASAATGGRILMNSENFFSNMSRPSGILTTTQTIQQVTADRLKSDWRQKYSSGNIGETAVLGDGLDFKPLILNATDSQLIEQLRWTVEDVARVFRVPLYMLADPSKTNYRNNEQMARSYFQGCLQYHVEGIEHRLHKDLMLDNDLVVSFDTDALFRMESDVRFAAYQKAIQSGVYSINEARAREGLPPVKGGEVPRIQMQYVPIDQPVPPQVPGASAVPEPEDEDPPEDDDEDDDLPADDDDEDDDGGENGMNGEDVRLVSEVSSMLSKLKSMAEARGV